MLLGAAAGLPHHQGKLVVQLSFQDLVADPADQFGLSLGSTPRSRLVKAAAFFR